MLLLVFLIGTYSVVMGNGTELNISNAMGSRCSSSKRSASSTTLTKKITPLRKEYKIAMRIEEHIPKIKALLDAERNIEMKRNNLNKNKERGKER